MREADWEGALLLARAEADRLDASDRLRSFRDRFELPTDPSGQPLVYLSGNSLGLMPTAARTLIAETLDDWAALGVRGHLEARLPWYGYHELFRDAGARLVGARAGEVVMMNTLTVNIHLMMASFYQPSGRRTKVFVEDGAFSSDRYAVDSHVAWHGLDPRDAVLVATPRQGEQTLRPDDLLDTIDEHGHEIALVLLGGVNFFTGQVLDMAAVAGAAKHQGCHVGFDLAHAAGNVPLHLHDWDVDFGAWCSYKYLNAGPGAIAGCFVHERHGRDTSIRRLAGWWGNDPGTRFRMRPEFVARVGADGWQVSNPPILSLAPLKSSLDIFEEVGMPALRTKSVQLTGFLAGLISRLCPTGVAIITPGDSEQRGAQLSLRVSGDARDVFAQLTDRGIVVDHREPDVIRVAPVPLYNTFADAWTFAKALSSVVRGVPESPGAR